VQDGDVEIVLERGLRYSEIIISSVPPCPSYVKRAKLIRMLVERFKLSKKRAASVVDATLGRWVQRGLVRRAKIRGYYCVDGGER